MKKSYLTVTDQFCGAGGSSQGARRLSNRMGGGLEKYGQSDFVVYLDHSKAGHLVSDINEAIRTQTTAQVAAIVTKNYSGDENSKSFQINKSLGTVTTADPHAIVGVPYIVKIDRSTKDYGINEPVHTVVGGGLHHGVVGIPFIDSQFSKGSLKGANDPIGAIMTKDKYGLLSAPFIVTNNGKSQAHEIKSPLGSVTAGGIKHGILSNDAMNAFLSYYYGNAQATGINEATGTITTKDRIALVMKPLNDIRIEDCTYRMLKPHEIQKAMAFENDYVVCGNSRDKVKQLGNAVTPPAMEWLLERGIETFM